MENPENPSSLEREETIQETQEKLANLEFDIINLEFDIIFNKIYGTSSLQEMSEGENAYEIQKDGNVQGRLRAFNDPNIGLQKITIQWDGESNNNSMYTLSRIDGKYKLETSIGESGEGQVIENISSEELSKNILPNFKKRLREGEMIRIQQRQKAIEDANQYAYQQDYQDADKLLQENGLA